MNAADVLIVGGGSAGCVLAARLSEDPRRTVLLLEAGPDHVSEHQTPPEILDGHSLALSHDWGYSGDSGRAIRVPRPRIVGGSSATNATMALRGQPSDYDGWGLVGWSFRDILPCFRKLESDHDFADEWHGADGPLPIRRYRLEELAPAQAAFLAAARTTHACAQDLNAPDALGAGTIPMNTEGGIRKSAALTYLAAARARVNLTIRPQAEVDHVVLEGRRAVGVRLAAGGEMIHAARVVLSAGAFGSPAILWRSGVGPAEPLRQLGITLRQELPGVGAGLADHPLFTLHYAARRPTPSHRVPLFQTMLVLSSAQIFPTSVVPVGILKVSTGGLLSLNTAARKPRSTGSVTLVSKDPTVAPRIHFDHLACAEDLEVMLEAVLEARRLAAAAPLSELVLREVFPGDPVQTRAQLAAVLRRHVTTYHHACGTCRMGRGADAVVNASGEVHGLDALSVIDASILPTIPSANIHLTVLMVAEHCAVALAGTSH